MSIVSIAERMVIRTIYSIDTVQTFFNTFALRKAKIVFNFGLAECNRVKQAPRG